MVNETRWLVKTFFTILLFFSVFIASAADDVEAISAGVDQTVNAGDVVNLSGSIVFEEDQHKHKHSKKHKHKRQKKYKEYKKPHKHGHKRGHEKDENEIVITWMQTAGTTVALDGENTLAPLFTAPGAITADEILTFLLTVSDNNGNVVATDSVNVTVIANQVIQTSTVSGRITDVSGNVLTNVSINALSSGASVASATSTADGQFVIELTANNDAVLQFSAAGYADQVVPVRSPKADGNIFLDISMIARGASQSFDAAVGGSLTGSDGASVMVSADSFVDAAGNPVTGNIDLTITPVDVSRPASLAAFPGEFSGVLEGDTTGTPIISFGTVEFEFTSGGQPVNLAPGQTANVIIPMYFDTYQDGTPVNLGDMIPLWSLNEDTGIWQQEGTGTVIFSNDSPTGFAMDATVTHFSWWNCDVSSNVAQAIVTVFGPDTGTALIRARTTADIGWRPTMVETVSEVGVPTSPLYIPSNGEVCFWADIEFDNGSSGPTPEVCVTAAPGSLINVDLVAPGTGPVVIATQPAAAAGILDMAGSLSFPVDPVSLRTATFETSVNYAIISGALPSGLSLNPVTATRAEIVGVPTESGAFSIVVEATDSDGFTDTVIINFNITTEPVVITTSPAPTAGVLQMNGYLGFPVTDVQVFPTSLETDVTYSILGGGLPAGLTISQATTTMATISGVPTETGVFNVIVRATDNDGYTDNINVRFTVTADTPPPLLDEFISVGFGRGGSGLPEQFDLNSFNFGGPVTSWTLTEDIISGAGPVPAGISLDPVTGILTITEYCIFWSGQLTATNGGGSSTVPIEIYDGGCA